MSRRCCSHGLLPTPLQSYCHIVSSALSCRSIMLTIEDCATPAAPPHCPMPKTSPEVRAATCTAADYT
ncbi:hypothetical protein M011DRAFT_467301 [Sporormia fimetaria CBS 119925]|uniref:Uncharacterized protein n=1 Tax=Sporormia fimetaria CBS 119925 TaxID=1340428 RepID=A0A6A6VAQ0_9PLEO|nr:hypothetical protein M011DRAFT_467301 [Sporormia fimetaria CBS 119925]